MCEAVWLSKMSQKQHDSPKSLAQLLTVRSYIVCLPGIWHLQHSLVAVVSFLLKEFATFNCK